MWFCTVVRLCMEVIRSTNADGPPAGWVTAYGPPGRWGSVGAGGLHHGAAALGPGHLHPGAPAVDRHDRLQVVRPQVDQATPAADAVDAGTGRAVQEVDAAARVDRAGVLLARYRIRADRERVDRPGVPEA